jgi:DNA-binding MarR family transcriptional regulator
MDEPEAAARRDGEVVAASAAMPVAELRASLRSFLHQTEAIARRAGLTPQRYLLLLMIKGARDGSERSTVTELAERLRLAQSTVTELVDRAEAAGLVNRSTSRSDRRIAELSLTREGERRFALAFGDANAERRYLLEAIRHLTQE